MSNDPYRRDRRALQRIGSHCLVRPLGNCEGARAARASAGTREGSRVPSDLGDEVLQDVAMPKEFPEYSDIMEVNSLWMLEMAGTGWMPDSAPRLVPPEVVRCSD